MNKLSNRGQSLVLFIVFIPFFLMLGVFIVDVSFSKYNNNRLKETTKMIVRYGLNHIDNDPYNEMVNLLYKNDEKIDDYKIDIDVPNKKIIMNCKSSSKGFFGNILGKDIYNENINIIGYFKEDKIIIEEGAK